MNCSDFRSQLDDYLDNRLVARNDACERHIASCPDCALRVAAERRLRGALAKLPVPAPRAGFESRVLRAATGAASAPRPRSLMRHAAMAAALVAVVGGFVALRMPTQPGAAIATIPAEGVAASRTVRLVLTAPRALPGAQIRLELPDDSEFAAYKGQRVLEWTTDLAKGPNLLEVTINGPGEGIAMATVSYRGSQRTLPLPLDSAARTRTRIEPLSIEENRHA